VPLFNTGFQNPISNPKLPYSGVAAETSEMLDRDRNGDPIERDKSTWWNRFKINNGFRAFADKKK
jgi:hypothetical protein